MNQIVKTRSHDSRHGIALLNDPVLNKGTAFSLEERRQYGLGRSARLSRHTPGREAKRCLRLAHNFQT
jgi:hypothetical protein